MRPVGRRCWPAKTFLWIACLFCSRLQAHEGGPPTLALEPGQIGVYVIKSDVTSEGGLSFYLAHPGYDTNVVQVTPEDTFSSPGDGRFLIKANGPGKTILTLGWLYPPHDAGGLFTVEVTVNQPATTPPSAANVTSSATSQDPVNLFSGELTMLEQPDLNLGGPMPLQFVRYYGSGLSREALVQSPLGDNWSCNFDWRLLRAGRNVTVVSWEGRRIPFEQEGTGWRLTGLRDVPFQLIASASEWTLGDPRDNRVYTFDTNGVLTAIADGQGNVHTLTYQGGRLAQVSDGLGRSLTLTSGGFQQLLSVTDGIRTVNFGYTNIVVTDSAGGSFKILDQYFALASVSNPLGNATRYRYGGNSGSNHVRALLAAKVRPLNNIPYAQSWDGQGRVAAQIESGTNTHAFVYEANSASMTNPLGGRRRVVHSASGQLATLTDEAGQVITLLSNTNGQRTSVTSRRGGTTRFAYHAPSGKVAAITNANGAVVQFEFEGRVYRGITFYDTTRIIYPNGSTEEFSHDASGNVIAFKDRAGKVWRMTYDDHGQVLSVLNPLGGQVTFTYNPDGTIASRADSDSGPIHFSYDQFHRMTNAVRSDGTSVQTGYDAADRVTVVTDERGHAYRYQYDANDNLIAVTDPAGGTTRYAYDLRDRLTRVTDRRGKITATAYDPLELLSVITNRNGHVIRLNYDTRQRLAALIDPAGQVWTFAHDAEGILKAWANPLGQSQAQVSDPLGFPVEYADAMGETRALRRDHLQLVTNVVDELSRTNAWTYDARGLLEACAKPVIGSAQFERNELGQVAVITDPDGQRWTCAHTPMGRPRRETDPLGRATTYTYNSRGQLARTVFPDGSTRDASYDARGNPVTARFSDGTELRYGHDSLNQLIEANDVTLAYDAESRITRTTSSDENFSAEYDPGGRLVAAGYLDDLLVVHYEYDSRDRLTRVSDSMSGAVLTFAYDDAGRMTGVVRANGVDGVYTYDPTGRLIRIQEGDLIDLNYTLDAAGQVSRINLKAPLDPGGLITPGHTTLTYDAARQISSPGYMFDARGRLIRKPGQEYAYDGASRLIRAGAATLTYNGLNDVVSRAEGASVARYYYHYAIGLGPMVAEKDQANGRFVRYYVWSPGGRLLYLIDAATGAPSYAHFDKAGSTIALTDARGAVTDAYSYSPYGQVLARTGVNSQPFTFVGRYGVRREGASLYQMRARYYSPETASFLTKDPIPFRHADIHSLNPYHYAGGDPLRAADPEGLDRTVWFFGHAWIEVDVYDAQGKVKGRLALNFAPESGKSDYQVLMPRNIIYPHVAGYDIKSTQLEDELLLREWKRLQNDPKRGPRWNPIQNCVWRTLEYAHGEIPMTLEDERKLLATAPVRTDVTMTAAPPGPWYKQAYNWVGDSWGEFEEWLEKALE
ncbi:MAG: RHS repeat-associated core domain-containing protein [Verrucomicrobiota bacterium]